MRLFIKSLSLLILSFPALADTELPIEITPHIGYRFGGDFDNTDPVAKIKLREDMSYGLLVAWPFDNKRQGEFLISHYDTSFSQKSDSVTTNLVSNNDLGITYMHLGGNVPVSDGALPMWVSGGLGLTHMSPDDKTLDDETRFSINIGLNTKVELNENLSLHFGGRIYATFFNSESAIFCDTDLCSIYISNDIWVQSEVNAGLTFSF